MRQTELEHESGVKSVSVNTDATLLATGTVDGWVCMWDLASHRQLLQLHSKYQHTPLSHIITIYYSVTLS